MAEPLRKLKNNRPYERLRLVEQLLDAALKHTPEQISKRAYIREKADADYLPTECLVHLVRHAFRSGNAKLRDMIVNPLLKRCELILRPR